MGGGLFTTPLGVQKQRRNMKAFFKDIFDYHNQTNQKLVKLFFLNPDKISERSIFLFSHSINAHQIWNSRILKTDSVGVTDVHSIAECESMNEKNYMNSLKIIDQYDLSDKVVYGNSGGNQFINSVQEILFHISNHFSHHRGQIMTDLRQSGIELFITDYIFFKR